MRRKQRLLKTILSAPRVTTKNSIGETVEGWGEAVATQATVLPLGDGISAELYGERSTSMRKLIADKPDGLEVNNGVWLPGETGAEPPWRIVSVEAWPNHTEATIEKRVV
jgi:hypothetical protein